MAKRNGRPRHQTPVSTYSNSHTAHRRDQVYFADVEARKRSMEFEPTADELALVERCVRLMRESKKDRPTSVHEIVTQNVKDEARQVLLIRYVISTLYDAGVDCFNRDQQPMKLALSKRAKSTRKGDA